MTLKSDGSSEIGSPEGDLDLSSSSPTGAAPSIGNPATGNPATGNPATGGPAVRTFDKPNLQLRDPDPYAFANRIRRLTIIACVMACLAIAPFLSQTLSYQIARGQLLAKFDVADQRFVDAAPAVQAMESFQQVSQLVCMKVGPSVVSVYPRNARAGRRGLQGQGSGFIVDSAGYVITNFHVVQNATQLTVQFANGETSDAAIIGADPETDLALLQVDSVDLPAISWGKSEELEQGDVVWAVGSPFGLQSSATFGVVSAKSRRAGSGATDSLYQEFLQTDAAVNPGNSGGPLVNLSGQVVGVNTAIMGDSYRGVSFAIPSDLAKEKYEVLRERRFIERGFLGIEPRLPEEALRRRYGLEVGEGVWVFACTDDSPATYAGMQSGDVILKWNDQQATDPTLLSRTIAATPIGSTAKVVIRRLENGKPIDKTIDVRVGRKAIAEPRAPR
ncbi:S1C family serine protease [Botrimarina hoheduenensis]|uniref:Putative periplasmic serine endoprotease DegP-like n=1 Tax=Botrimarina hoheduenensis TaxID=2528000 RepID=A0A5C5WDM7_9BACT|nr:trypsin-like peptidase domain-containing protein [Botrimarina hoheduenensis]TWT48740.1 putative periplasmic serine endoprotease DegP-like precursor [Botrimarina hoheduenensis]